MKNAQENEDSLPPEKEGTPEEQLNYRLQQQKLTAQFSIFALQNRDFEALLQRATELVAEGLQTKYAKVGKYLEEENKFLICAGVGWDPGVVGVLKVDADLESPTGYAFLTTRPVISNHLSKEKRFRTPKILARHGIKRAINVIIWGKDQPFGVLEADSPEEGRFTEADVVFMESFANLLAVALDRTNALSR